MGRNPQAVRHRGGRPRRRHDHGALTQERPCRAVLQEPSARCGRLDARAGGRTAGVNRRPHGRRPRTRLALLGLALSAVVSCGTPASPGPATITLQIGCTLPSPDTLPPPGPDAATCFHHYAPVNLMLETSWGEARRLEPVTALAGHCRDFARQRGWLPTPECGVTRTAWIPEWWGIIGLIRESPAARA